MPNTPFRLKLAELQHLIELLDQLPADAPAATHTKAQALRDRTLRLMSEIEADLETEADLTR